MFLFLVVVNLLLHVVGEAEIPELLGPLLQGVRQHQALVVRVLVLRQARYVDRYLISKNLSEPYSL